MLPLPFLNICSNCFPCVVFILVNGDFHFASCLQSSTDGLKVDRRGSMMLTFCPAIAERKYDWEQRQVSISYNPICFPHYTFNALIDRAQI